MTNMHSAIPEEKLTEAYRILLEMRDNCVKHADDQYDDPKREAKYEALKIAIDAMGRSLPPRWISVEERLPEGKAIAVNFTPDTYGFGEMIIGYVYAVQAFAEDWEPGLHVAENDHEILRHVSHWMPFPNRRRNQNHDPLHGRHRRRI